MIYLYLFMYIYINICSRLLLDLLVGNLIYVHIIYMIVILVRLSHLPKFVNDC